MTYIVKENQDGTVTIDRKIYNELRVKAESYEKLMSEISIAILTVIKESIR